MSLDGGHHHTALSAGAVGVNRAIAGVYGPVEIAGSHEQNILRCNDAGAAEGAGAFAGVDGGEVHAGGIAGPQVGVAGGVVTGEGKFPGLGGQVHVDVPVAAGPV